MEVRDADDADIDAITAIYNHAVRHSTAIWNEQTVDAENRRTWLAERQRLGYPVLVAADHDDVVGYASFGDWRAFDGYRHTVEHSVYVRSDVRARGTGGLLMAALIDRARGIGKHVMVAGIESDNTASISLHTKLGFTQVGRMPQVGAKFGRWLDLTFMQLCLDARPSPDDDLP